MSEEEIKRLSDVYETLSVEQRERLKNGILNNPTAYERTKQGALSIAIENENYGDANFVMYLTMVRDDKPNHWLRKGLNQSVADDQHLGQSELYRDLLANDPRAPR